MLWAGEDAADVRTMKVFLLGGGQSQAVLEEEWRQVGNEESGHFSTELMGSNSLLLATSGWLSNVAESAINRV